jgi:hypothetical protein
VNSPWEIDAVHRTHLFALEGGKICCLYRPAYNENTFIDVYDTRNDVWSLSGHIVGDIMVGSSQNKLFSLRKSTWFIEEFEVWPVARIARSFSILEVTNDRKFVSVCQHNMGIALLVVRVEVLSIRHWILEFDRELNFQNESEVHFPDQIFPYASLQFIRIRDRYIFASPTVDPKVYVFNLGGSLVCKFPPITHGTDWRIFNVRDLIFMVCCNNRKHSFINMFDLHGALVHRFKISSSISNRVFIEFEKQVLAMSMFRSELLFLQ